MIRLQATLVVVKWGLGGWGQVATLWVVTKGDQSRLLDRNENTNSNNGIHSSRNADRKNSHNTNYVRITMWMFPDTLRLGQPQRNFP